MTTLEQLRNVDLAEDLIQANWKHNRRNIVIVCEDLDFVWDERDYLEVADLWKQGKDIRDIADVMKRPVDEVMMCITDLSRKSRIQPREHGAFASTPTDAGKGGFTKDMYLQMRSEGHTKTFIRKEFGMSTTTFYYWLRKWGVK